VAAAVDTQPASSFVEKVRTSFAHTQCAQALWLASSGPVVEGIRASQPVGAGHPQPGTCTLNDPGVNTLPGGSEIEGFPQ